jgi:hypothetical protein
MALYESCVLAVRSTLIYDRLYRRFKMFDSMTIDELEGKELDLELDIAEIQGQLDMDDVDSRGDDVWRARATQALRYKKIQLRQAQYILAKKRRGDRRGRRLESAFVEIARKTLKPEIYRGIMREAALSIEFKKVA